MDLTRGLGACRRNRSVRARLVLGVTPPAGGSAPSSPWDRRCRQLVHALSGLGMQMYLCWYE